MTNNIKKFKKHLELVKVSIKGGDVSFDDQLQVTGTIIVKIFRPIMERIYKLGGDKEKLDDICNRVDIVYDNRETMTHKQLNDATINIIDFLLNIFKGIKTKGDNYRKTKKL